MANSTNFTLISPAEKGNICQTYLDVGKGNDNVEGFDGILKAAEGIFKAVDELQPGSVGPTTKRIMQQQSPRMIVEVLSDREPNAADLAQVDDSVNLRKIIDSSKLGKNARVISTVVCSLIALGSFIVV